ACGCDPRRGRHERPLGRARHPRGAVGMGDLGRRRRHGVRDVRPPSGPGLLQRHRHGGVVGRGPAARPDRLAGLALLGVAADRLLAAGLDRGARRAVIAVAIVATVLCATIAVPGVIKQSDLDARPVNLPAGAGVLMALGLTLYAWRRTGAGAAAERTRGDRIALWVAVAYALLALPWILANLGFYAGDVPGLHAVFMSKKILPEPGHPTLRAVHL